MAKSDLSGADERPIGAAGDMRLLGAADGGLAVFDAEQRLPKKPVDKGRAQRLRIGCRHRLHFGDYVLRVVVRAAQRDFAHPDRRAEAVRVSRLIVHRDPANLAVTNDSRNVFNVPVEQIDFSTAYGKPAAADDPGPPAADRGHIEPSPARPRTPLQPRAVDPCPEGAHPESRGQCHSPKSALAVPRALRPAENDARDAGYIGEIRRHELEQQFWHSPHSLGGRSVVSAGCAADLHGSGYSSMMSEIAPQGAEFGGKADALQRDRKQNSGAAPMFTAMTEPVRDLTSEDKWDAVRRRDAAFDGAFVFAVKTTGVYCRPSCASRSAKRENVSFFATPEAAERAGFRACKRCRPDRRRSPTRHVALVRRACATIAAAEAPPSIARLRPRRGLSPFHFHRVFKKVTGVTPKAYAAEMRARRAAESLRTAGTVTEAIYDAGFNASSRFYETSSARLGMTPTAARRGGEGEVDPLRGRAGLARRSAGRGHRKGRRGHPDRRRSRRRWCATFRTVFRVQARRRRRGVRAHGRPGRRPRRGARPAARPAARHPRHGLPAAGVAGLRAIPAGAHGDLCRDRQGDRPPSAVRAVAQACATIRSPSRSPATAWCGPTAAFPAIAGASSASAR